MLCGASATAGNFIEPADVQTSASLGAAPNVSRLRNMWFAGQPRAIDLEAAAEEGITTVINLRTSAEMRWDEETAVEALGMTYYHLPVDGNKPFSRATFDMLDVLMAKYAGQPVLIHCSSSNRAAAWLATYLVREKSMLVDEAMRVARRAGMTKKSLETKVREFLENPAP
jgi:uncharacterized protein (TIGR01244 family)